MSYTDKDRIEKDIQIRRAVNSLYKWVIGYFLSLFTQTIDSSP